MATRTEKIKELELEISIKQLKLEKLLSKRDPVQRGDFIVLMRDYEWVAPRGTRMWVDKVCDGHILARSEKPENRHYGIYWISNNDFVKE